MTKGLLESLAAIVGPEHVLSTPEDREEFALDAYALWHGTSEDTAANLPEAIVRPDGTGEVQALVRLAVERGVPLIPYGAGTGVMGAATPARGGIVVDLRRMNRIRHVSPGALIARVEAGAILSDVDDRLAEQGLMLGHDPWSKPLATIGGAISTDGVGYLAAGYGSMGEQVLGLEAVLPDGTLMTARDISKAPAIRLDRLLIGAEGVLGIITSAVLRVFPRPEARLLHAVAFPEFSSGYQAIVGMAKAGIRPAMIDYSQEPLDNGPRATLYLAFDGPRASAAAQRDAGLHICADHGGEVLADDEALNFWDQRHESANRFAERTALGRRFARALPSSGRRFDYLHLALPEERVLEYKERCEALLGAAGMQAREYAIWGRPDLFSVAYQSSTSDDGDVTETSERLLRLAHSMGGSIEYCHGVGLKLLPLLSEEYGETLSVIKRVKQALDPAGIMNPGKLGV